MSRIKSYNWEKYSVFDILEYLAKKGYRVLQERNKFSVTETDIAIDVPKSSGIAFVVAEIRYENAQPRFDLQQNERLFRLLSSKFGKKSGESPKVIKDFEKTKQLWDDFAKKLWIQSREQRKKYYGDTGQDLD